ncbi:gliding motility lipoprotein GldH [Roseivirga thermotolerans]|jgi:gliding motility-associated lipoprotein GldH|uniref:gliding motility lipoprotein GldH n=1 Tax=Roseivirga thermotolerans TaxID=1758176 RepID=UPI00273EB8AE|nr:gliding motility lipoprotein GldH [Roseivirga thermotolerans]
MTRKAKLAIATLLLFVWACDAQRVFEDDQSFEQKSWHMNEMPEFSFEIDDTTPKNIYFKLRNDLEYPFQNLYVTYYLLDEQNEQVTSDLINISLFDEVSGKPLGKGSSIYQSSERILEGYSFPQPGKYTFRVAQYMRSESLAGVHSVGVRVEEAN